MRFTIVCVGKMTEEYYRAAAKEYEKRLSRFGKTEIIELPDEKEPNHMSEGAIREILKKEGVRVRTAIPKGAYVICLAIGGKKLSSEGFAAHLDALANGGVSHVVFLIGGSVGLEESIIKEADFRLSFSDMTFPHRLMRVILLEQVYRACKINANESYHK